MNKFILHKVHMYSVFLWDIQFVIRSIYKIDADGRVLWENVVSQTSVICSIN